MTYGLSKFCSALGLSSPIVKTQFIEHVKYLEEEAFELRDENFKITATQAGNLTIKENNLDLLVENIDIPTSFDGAWCLHRSNANRGVVIAIAEKTAQVKLMFLMLLLCKTCVQCT